jgi:superfamily II DNA/RNA helicase
MFSAKNRQQLWALADPPHIVVGNPKSLLRLVELGRLKMSSLSLLVIDEVDACLLSIDMKKVREHSKFAFLLFCS